MALVPLLVIRTAPWNPPPQELVTICSQFADVPPELLDDELLDDELLELDELLEDELLEDELLELEEDPLQTGPPLPD